MGMPLPEATMRLAISSPEGPGVPVEDGDVVGVDAQQPESGIAVTGHVGGDGLQAQAFANGFCHVGLVLDDQHTHTQMMLRPGTYRPRIENVIRAGNITMG
jgi:hypothetical protein